MGGFFDEPLGGSFGVEAKSGIGLELGVCGRGLEFGGVAQLVLVILSS